MKSRNVWIRRKKEKGKLVGQVVEGRKGKNTLFIWTISNDLTRLLEHLLKTSFWSEEKSAKIKQKLDSLEIKQNNDEKGSKRFA